MFSLGSFDEVVYLQSAEEGFNFIITEVDMTAYILNINCNIVNVN